MSNKNVLKAGIGYTIGNILIKGISFLTLPLFSRIMTTEEFGIFSVFLSFDSILFVIIGMALHSSVRNANLEFENKIDDYVSSISLIYILNLIILLVVVLIFGNFLSIISGLNRNLLVFLVIHSFCSALFTLYNIRISINYSYFKYLIVSLFNTVCNVGLSIIFILSLFKNNAVMGRVLGATLSFFFITVFILFCFYKQAIPFPNKKYWTFGIKYSLPIIPHGLSQVLLSQFDRVMINTMVSSSSAGIYSLAANLKIVLLVVSDSIATAWTTWFYEQAYAGHIEIIQKRALSLSLLFLGIILIFSGISPELILILGGTPYEEGRYAVIPMIMDAYVLFLYNLIIPSEYFKEKTIFIMLGTIFAAIINIITNYIFIIRYGYIAAAYTTLFSYFCYLLLHIFISRKVFGSFILPLKHILLLSIIVSIFSLFFIFFLNSFFVRLIAILIIFLILTKYFLKNIHQIKG